MPNKFHEDWFRVLLTDGQTNKQKTQKPENIKSLAELIKLATAEICDFEYLFKVIQGQNRNNRES